MATSNLVPYPVSKAHHRVTVYACVVGSKFGHIVYFFLSFVVRWNIESILYLGCFIRGSRSAKSYNEVAGI